jgi:excisionase family DNA binding protein
MTIALDGQPWLTADEAAVYLKVKTRSLLRWVREGKIRAYALTGTKRRIWRFLRSDLDATLLANAVLPSTTSSLPVRSQDERTIQ